MNHTRTTLADVRRRQRLQREALICARVELYRQRATFGRPVERDGAAIIAEAEAVAARQWRKTDGLA